MDTAILVALGLVSTLGMSAAVAGSIAHLKKRSPLEGFLLGLALGPVGVVVEAMRPAWTRPPVDDLAWHSFRSLVSHQAVPDAPRRHRSAPRGPA